MCYHRYLGAFAKVQYNLLDAKGTLKNSSISIDASFSRQPLVKGERLVRLEMNAGYRYRLVAEIGDVCQLQWYLVQHSEEKLVTQEGSAALSEVQY